MQDALRMADEALKRVREEARRAEEGKKLAEEGKRRAEERMRRAEEGARSARAEQKDAERRLREGIQPIIPVTAEEIAETKRRLCYKEGAFHFAVAGIAGSGKSSLINAFRGLRNNDGPDVAPTGVVETTATVSRYVDPTSHGRIVWYDIPGAGTLKIPDWEYFHAQGLYIFDCIIVLFDTRFTATDVAILRNCARFNIPSCIVRSKANQHIRNAMEDMGYDGDGKDVDHRTLARERYIAETRQTVQRNLDAAQLPQQRVYIVSKDTLVGAVKGRPRKDIIDEQDLLSELAAARTRRL